MAHKFPCMAGSARLSVLLTWRFQRLSKQTRVLFFQLYYTCCLLFQRSHGHPSNTSSLSLVMERLDQNFDLTLFVFFLAPFPSLRLGAHREEPEAVLCEDRRLVSHHRQATHRKLHQRECE